MTLSSGEQSIDFLGITGTGPWQTCRPACIFDNELHTIKLSIDTYYFVDHIKFPLESLMKKDADHRTGIDKIDVSALADNSNWYFNRLYKHTLPEDFATGVGLTANLSNMYAFFSSHDPFLDDGGTPLFAFLQARKYNKAVKGGQPVPAQWEEGETYLRMPGGKAYVHGWSGSISATSFGENQIVVVMPTINYPEDKHYTPGLHVLLMDTRDWESSKDWTARAYRRISLTDDIVYHDEHDQRLPLNVTEDSKGVSIDWFVTPHVDPESNKLGADPDFYLALNFEAAGLPHSMTLPLAVKTDDADLTQIDEEAFKVRPALKIGAVSRNNGEHMEYDLKRDPSGRLRRFSLPKGGGEIANIFASTSTLPSEANGFNLYQDDSQNFKSSEGVIGNGPGGAFHVFTALKTDVKVDGHDATEIPVLEFVLYGANKVQMRQYGTIRTIGTQRLPKMHDTNTPTQILGGYMDTPIPFPFQNFEGQVGVNYPKKVGQLLYTNKQAVSEETKSIDSWSAGFESEGKTTKGVGPAWKISVEGGMGSVGQQTIDTTVSTFGGAKVEVKLADDGEELEIEADAFVSLFHATIHLTCYQFLDMSGVLVNDGLSQSKAASAKLAEHLVSMGPSKKAGASFDAYMVDPGNLESYKPEEINKRMKALGHPADDYFQDVIVANALPMGTDIKGLSYSWEGTSSTIQSFEELKGDFKEQSWEFDADVYAGVSGGEGFTIFGFGEDAEAEFLAGAKYSTEHSSSQERSVAWGIELENEELDVPKSEAEDAVAAYSFNAYFLPPPKKEPNYWTTQLRKYAPLDGPDLSKAEIDKNSGCWRIVLVVTSITWMHPDKDAGRVNYTYAGNNL